MLRKAKNGMYSWFIHILGIPKSPKVFLEEMNFILNFYVSDYINLKDCDNLLFNKSTTKISKSTKSNSFLQRSP